MGDRYADVSDETLLRWLGEARERRVNDKARVRHALLQMQAGAGEAVCIACGAGAPRDWFFRRWRLMCAQETSRDSRVRARRLNDEWAQRKRWRVGAWRITELWPDYKTLEHVARPELTLSVSRYGSGARLFRRLSDTLGEQLAWFAVTEGPDDEMVREAVASADIVVAHLRPRS